jgi:hypothetical protein
MCIRDGLRGLPPWEMMQKKKKMRNEKREGVLGSWTLDVETSLKISGNIKVRLHGRALEKGAVCSVAECELRLRLRDPRH